MAAHAQQTDEHRVSDEQARRMLRLMIVARTLEERLAAAYAEGKLSGWIHSCEGHEAFGAAVSVCLDASDHLVPHYRSRPEQLGKGMTVREVVAEVFATVDAASRGRGGETHVSSVEHRVYGMTGVLGANIAMSAGVALGSKLRGTPEATVCSFGDGTANRGTFHEGLNLAAVWDLPVVFVCENNDYAELSKIGEYLRVEDIADRAAGFGIPGYVVDGHDPEALAATLWKALEDARSGLPSLIEAKMVRRRGHWEGDPQQYRSAEEIEGLAEIDPVPTYRRRALEEHGVSEDEVAAWESAATEEVESAIEWASSRPGPSREDVLGGVYAEAVDG